MATLGDYDDEFDFAAPLPRMPGAMAVGSGFDFDAMPDAVLVEILKLLPFKDRIRVGQVNRRFRRMISSGLDESGSVRLGDWIFRGMSAHELSQFLDGCWLRVAKIEFPLKCGPGYDDWLQSMWAAELVHFSFPFLVDLDLGNVRVGGAVLDRVVRQNPKLRTLIWNTPSGINIGNPSLESRSLKKLRISYDCNYRYDHRLRGALPNLKNLAVDLEDFTNGIIVADIYAVCPNVEILQLGLRNCSFVFSLIDDFWRLSKLRSLRIVYDRLGDDDLSKIACSFLRLEELDVQVSDATNQTVAELDALENLRELRLTLNRDRNYNDGVAALVECEQLEIVAFNGATLSKTTVVEFFRRCPRLSYFRLRKIADVDSPKKAADFVESLESLGKRRIEIVVSDPDQAPIWKSPRVSEALEKIAGDDGPMIKIW